MKNGISVDVDELELVLRQGYGLPELKSKNYLDANTEKTLEVFDEFGVKATFFVNGASVAPFPHLIKKIADAGHEVAAHGYSHMFLDGYQNEQEYRNDLKRCIGLIEDQTGKRPIGYRAPGNTIYRNREFVLQVLQSEGFQYDSSIPSAGNQHQHGYRRGPNRPFLWDNGLLEIPMDFYKLAGVRFPLIGAHALRLAPYWVTAKGLRMKHAQELAQFMYIHSFELYKQPVSRECVLYRFPVSMIYLARRGPQMLRKFRKLIQEFEFVPYRELLDSLQREELPTYSIAKGFAEMN